MGKTMMKKSWLLVAFMVVTAGVAQAAPITINVNCAGSKVGEISVNNDGTGISGGFTSTVGGPPPTLAAAAANCGEDHFNWYQIVVTDNGKAKDKNGNFLTPPYIDPPPGGYQGTWEDDLPWYWNEYPGPGEATSELSRKTTADTLKFGDFPSTQPGDSISFVTWLVSLNSNGSFHSWHEGFSWEYVQNDRSVKNIVSLGDGTFPTDAQYKNLLTGFATSVPEPLTLVTLLLSVPFLFLVRQRRA
jgi:hypothetical protein